MIDRWIDIDPSARAVVQPALQNKRIGFELEVYLPYRMISCPWSCECAGSPQTDRSGRSGSATAFLSLSLRPLFFPDPDSDVRPSLDEERRLRGRGARQVLHRLGGRKAPAAAGRRAARVREDDGGREQVRGRRVSRGKGKGQERNKVIDR